MTMGSVAGRALPILAGMLLSRTLGLQKFAVVGIVMTWAAIVPSMTTWGIGLVATQTLARYGTPSYRSVVCWGFGSAFVALLVFHGLILLGGANWITAVYPGIQISNVGSSALAIGIASSIFVLIQAFLNGAHRPKILSFLLAFLGVLQGFALMLAAVRRDVVHLVDYLLSAFLLNAVISSIALWTVVKEQVKTSRENPITLRSWLSQILPSIGASAAVAPVTFVCASMLGDEVDGMRQLGAFFALEQIAMMLTYIPTLMVQSTVPVLASLISENKRKAFDYVSKMASYQFAVLALLIVIAALTSKFVLGAYGQLLDFQTPYLLMLLNIIISVPLATLGAYLQATGRFSLGSMLNVAWAVAFLVASFYLQHNGCTGIQIARLLATCVLGVGTVLVFCIMLRHELTDSSDESGLRSEKLEAES